MATIIKLLEEGVPRVLEGSVGMTFVVDHFTPGQRGPVAHVRDYRYPRVVDGQCHGPFQIWSIANGGYEVLVLPAEPREGERVRIKETGKVGEWVQTRHLGAEGERLTILTPGEPGVDYIAVPPGYVPDQFIEPAAA